MKNTPAVPGYFFTLELQSAVLRSPRARMTFCVYYTGGMTMIRGHFDGASRGNPGPAGAGAVIYDGETVVWRCARALGTCTNNEAEYMALAILADELEARGVKSAEICGDSKLVISQISGAWKIKEPRLAALARPIMAKLAALGASYRWIPRSLNAEADMLSNKALDEG